jgi:drug/metabolite transporter (DMT)-like permease
MTTNAARAILLLCVVIWGATFTATKICLAYVDAFELVGLRFAIGLPVLLLLIFRQRIPLRFTTREYASLGLGALIIGLHFVLQAFALNYTSATNTGWIIGVSPLALAVLSFILLGEKITSNQVFGIVVASLGILQLISQGDFRNIGWLKSAGDWLVLLTAHTWALYTIATRNVAKLRNPLAVTFSVFLPVTLLSLARLVSGDISKLSLLPPRAIIALLFLGILGTLAQWFWQIGVAQLGAARAGIFIYLEPLTTTVVAIAVLGESLTTFTAIGGLLVLGAVWWAER